MGGREAQDAADPGQAAEADGGRLPVAEAGGKIFGEQPLSRGWEGHPTLCSAAEHSVIEVLEWEPRPHHCVPLGPLAPPADERECSPCVLRVFSSRILSCLLGFPPPQDPMVYMNDKSPLVSHRERSLP